MSKISFFGHGTAPLKISILSSFWPFSGLLANTIFFILIFSSCSGTFGNIFLNNTFIFLFFYFSQILAADGSEKIKTWVICWNSCFRFSNVMYQAIMSFNRLSKIINWRRQKQTLFLAMSEVYFLTHFHIAIMQKLSLMPNCFNCKGL